MPAKCPSDGKGSSPFSGSLTFLSILIGIFTYSLGNALELKGTYPQAYPWYSLTLISGLSAFLTAVICFLLHTYEGEVMPRRCNTLVKIFFVFVIASCGLGVPLVGLWVFIITP
jgi:hypothetical protein